MTWHDLLFMHWPVPAETLRPLIPEALELDTFDGSAWIGVVPFSMTVMGSRFPEANVRTYVRHGGRSGVWFFSLDAASRLTVWGARRFYHLPYQFAEMSCVSSGDGVVYRSHRKSDPEVSFVGRYQPTGPPRFTAEGELDHWLTARFSLFSVNRRREVFRGDIEHPSWPLQAAEAEIEKNTLAAASGIVLPASKPLLHFAKRLDVVAFPVVRSN